MTYWGAKVLHYRSVELAGLLQIPVLIALAHGDDEAPGARSTLIDGEAKMYEQARILSVNAHKDVRWLVVKKPDLGAAFQEIAQALKTGDLPLPQFLDSEVRTGACSFLITAPLETLTAIEQLASRTATLSVQADALSTVTATCQGAFASPLPAEMATTLANHSIRVHKMIFGAMSLTVVVDAKERDRAIQHVHDLGFLTK